MRISRLVLTVLILLAVVACKPPPQVAKPAEPVAPGITQKEDMVAKNVASDCQFNLGFDIWEPYQYVDVGGNVAGLDVELISAVVKEMGCDINYRQGTWVRSLEKLRNGEVDMLLGASKTEAREEFALFSDAYRMEEFSLYIRKDDEIRSAYQTIDNFMENGSRIGVVDGYYYGPTISLLLDGTATSKFFMTSIIGELNVARLLDQDIDAFLEDSFIGASILRRKGLSDYIVPHGLTIQTGDVYVIFSKESVSAEQVADFNTALAKVKASAVYTDIMGRYGL
ncbi:MAG: polar amino acid transport system substrate-binding protein [Paraglaciecola sp.]|jgi:polar amino acid transport system substrate-binding protein